MIVFVIADTDGNDLLYRFATESLPVSPTYKQSGKASRIGGNPYLIYGPDVRLWLPMHTPDSSYSIVVATMSSGSLRVDDEGPDDTDKLGY